MMKMGKKPALLILPWVLLALLCLPALSQAEGKTVTYHIGTGVVTTEIKDGVLLVDDDSPANGTFALTGTDQDGDGRLDRMSLVVSSGHPAAKASADQLVVIKKANRLYIGKVTETASNGSNVTVSLSGEGVAYEDACDATIYTDTIGIKAYEPIGDVILEVPDKIDENYLSYNIVFDPHGLGWDTTFEFTCNISHLIIKSKDSAKISKDIRIYGIDLGILEFISMGDVKINLSIQADEIQGSADMAFKQVLKYTGWLGLGTPEMDHSEDTSDFSINSWDLSGKLFVGPSLGVDLGLIIAGKDILTFNLTGGAGPYVGVQSDTAKFTPEGYFHECNAAGDGSTHCLIGDVGIRIFAKADFKSVIKDGNIFDDKKDFDPFYHFYYSPAYKDIGSGVCPHKGYPLTVNVRDKAGNPIRDANIHYSPALDIYDHDADTDANGQVLFYVPSDPEHNSVRVEAVYWIGQKSFKRTADIVEKGINPDTGKPDPEKVDFEIDCNSYVYFNANGTHCSVPSTIVYSPYISSTVNLPDMVPDASAHGLAFVEWNDKKDGTGNSYAPGDSIKPPKNEYTLYAIWKEGPVQGYYYVYYNANGGYSAPDVGQANIHESYLVPDDKPVWDHHTFLGWSWTDTSGQVDFEAGQTVSGHDLNPGNDRSITLYAVWSFDDPVSKPVSLTYDMNGGPESEKPSVQWVAKDSTLQISEKVPVWNNMYIFSGWSLDRNALQADYFPGDSIHMTDDVTLYAIWQFRTVPGNNRIEFQDSGSGTVTGMPRTITYLYEEGIAINLPDNIPTKSGVSFIGWNTAADGSGTFYVPGSLLHPTGDMILYAQWRVISNSYVVLYNANGGLSAPAAQVVGLDQVCVLTSEPAVWSNHNFLGWSLSDGAFEPEYPAGQENVFSNPEGKKLIILYAVWSFDPVDQPVKLAYDMNGGPTGQKPADQWLKAGSCAQIPAEEPVWSNLYVFNGWSINQYATKGEYGAGDTIQVKKNTTLYAIWYYTPASVPIRVTYDLNGGLANKPDDQVYSKGLRFRLSNEKPSWDSQHTFLGWSPNKNDARPMYTAGQEVSFLWNTKLYAIWEISYRITEGNGSTWESSSQKGLRFVSDGNMRYFSCLKIDGKIVQRNQYNLSSGSTVIDLKKDYLKTLSEGKHTISICYYDGKADGTFTVSGKPLPVTGDTAEPILWAFCVLLGIAGTVLFLRKKKRR